MLINIVVASWLIIILPISFSIEGITAVNLIGTGFVMFVFGRMYQIAKQL